MRAVIDPNVLISGLLSPAASPAQVLRTWQQGRVEVLVSPLLLDELTRALAYPKLRERMPADDAAEEQAMTYVSADIVCDAPAGRIEGADAYRAFMGPFVQIVTDARLIAAFGDDETALLMYDTETIPVKSAPGAECLTVKDGKITHSRFVFDRAPFTAARNQAT